MTGTDEDLRDTELSDEIALLADLIVAASGSVDPMSPEAIDGILQRQGTSPQT